MNTSSNPSHELVPSAEVENAVRKLKEGPEQISIAGYIHSGPIPDPRTLAG